MRASVNLLISSSKSKSPVSSWCALGRENTISNVSRKITEREGVRGRHSEEDRIGRVGWLTGGEGKHCAGVDRMTAGSRCGKGGKPFHG